MNSHQIVIPAQAGIQTSFTTTLQVIALLFVIPAQAGIQE
jgi:hypothetical protein